MKYPLRALVCLASALLANCRSQAANSDSTPNEPAGAVVAVESVDRGALEQTLSCYGKVELAEDTQRAVSFERPGQVMTVAVVEGQLVSKSEELLRVGALPRNSPDLQQAKIAAEFAKREVARMQRLLDEKLATNQELQGAEKQSAAADTALQALAGGGTTGTPVRAPMDGIVAKVLVHRGELAQSGQTAMMLGTKNSLSVRVGFEVEDLPKLAQGMPIRIESAYHGEQQAPAHAQLSTLHRVVDAKTQLVEGIVHVETPPEWMAPGLAVRVATVLATRTNVLRVTKSALMKQGDTLGLFVIQNGRASWRTPAFGLDDGERVEVLSGLNESDRVATTGRTSLSDGMLVRVPSAGQP